MTKELSRLRQLAREKATELMSCTCPDDQCTTSEDFEKAEQALLSFGREVLNSPEVKGMREALVQIHDRFVVDNPQSGPVMDAEDSIDDFDELRAGLEEEN